MNRYLASFVALMSVSAGMAQAPGFTITGTVPGLTADHKVELVNRDERQGSEWNRLPIRMRSAQWATAYRQPAN